jgi:phospholipid/cholesterol/gamma-HCH transport system permease protein
LAAAAGPACHVRPSRRTGATTCPGQVPALRAREPGLCVPGRRRLSDLTAADGRARYHTDRKDALLRLHVGGDWIVDQATAFDEALQSLQLEGAREVEIDARGLTRLDSAGAWLLVRTKRIFEQRGATVRGPLVPAHYERLMEAIAPTRLLPRRPLPERWSLQASLEKVGRNTAQFVAQGLGILGFLGRVGVETSEAVVRPDRELPWPAFVNQIEETGIQALPILGLLSFLLGVVLAYQGADQLSRFGAEIFTVNLVGVAILREVGGLMAAIIVAGRSGSAFTAHIGTMKLNQEIDAMETMGLNTVEVLVLPRLFGLLVALPLLTLYANAMGVIGGMVMCYFELGITIPVFLRQLLETLQLSNWTFWLGLIKAPVFALIIALVGCFEGFRVEGNAGSVGRQTTRSVVESIFLVIVFDAGFSILFSVLGI